MKVFLFELSPKRTNLMDPAIRFIQLVLPTDTYHILLNITLQVLY